MAASTGSIVWAEAAAGSTVGADAGEGSTVWSVTGAGSRVAASAPGGTMVAAWLAAAATGCPQFGQKMAPTGTAFPHRVQNEDEGEPGMGRRPVHYRASDIPCRRPNVLCRPSVPTWNQRAHL